MKRTHVAVAGLLAVALSPIGAFAADDNFAFLDQMKRQGSQVRTLSPDEDRSIQGTSWSAVVRLMKLNVQIYGRVGWEIGRLLAKRQYGIDPGPYPGLKAALTGRF